MVDWWQRVKSRITTDPRGNGAGPVEEQVEEPPTPAPQVLTSLGTGSDVGVVRGRHYTAWDGEVQKLKRQGRYEEALTLLLEIITATEEEQAAEGDCRETAPGWTEQAAIVFRKLGRYEEEVQIIDRWEAHAGSPERWVGATHSKLITRRDKARALWQADQVAPRTHPHPSAPPPHPAREPQRRVSANRVPVDVLLLEPALTYQRLQEAIAADPDPERSWYLRWWAVDALVLQGHYEQAVDQHPPLGQGVESRIVV